MGEIRNTMIVAAAVILVGAGAGAGLGLMRRTPPVASPPPASVATDRPTDIDVHVAGWVINPGVVTVAEGSIVADAVAAAGGMRPGAAADGVNLAATLVSGQQVVVPGPDSVERSSPAGGPEGLISLNHATAAELETLPGVGPVLAGRIVAHRESQGPFQEVEDLLRVPGIGEAKLASLRDLVQP